MSSSFSFASMYMTRYEQKQEGLHWYNLWESPLDDDGTNFGIALVFIAIDTVLYLVIGALIVFVQRSMLRRSAVKSGGGSRVGSAANSNSSAGDEETEFGRRVNPLRLSSPRRQRVRGEVGVSLQGLTKVYDASSRKRRKVAVDGLTMDFHVGEVTCLLGHNGAGKSTTM